MLTDLRKKKLLASLAKEEISEGEDPKTSVDKDFYTEDTTIKGDPLGTTSVRSIDDEDDEYKKKKK